MDNTSKYLIHAAIAADGVVERSDVVGAVYGQTEGLLGEELDIRRLQESSKLGRIDVQIETRNGQSVGEITIATSLDRVETATLAAALETIDRVGPCKATVEVTELEDVRAATRRQVVERAQELLLDEFAEGTSDEIIASVRRKVATADVTTFDGLPAGPNVEGGDAVIVVEGRADVKSLLAAGVKNAIAVEGTDVPEAVASLTEERTATAFLDGDRGGELILQELLQVGDVDAVAFAPPDQSVEDLSRSAVLAALRSAVELASVEDAATARDLADAARDRSTVAGNGPAATANGPATTDGAGTTEQPAATEAAPTIEGEPAGEATRERGSTPGDGPVEDGGAEAAAAAEETRNLPADRTVDDASGADGADESERDPDAANPDESERDTDPAETDGEARDDSGTDVAGEDDEPHTVPGHVEALQDTGSARLLDDEATALGTVPAADAFDALEAAGAVPAAMVVDGECSQRLLDLAAQRGVREIVATDLGDFTKRPTDVRLRTAAAVLGG